MMNAQCRPTLKPRLRGVARAIAGGLALVAAPQAFAGSGFMLRSQSPGTLGMAQAGMSTGVGDPTTMIHNPATLGMDRGRRVFLSGTGIATRGSFDDVSATNALGGPVGGGDGGDNGTAALIPNLFVAGDLSETVRAGLAVTSLYGLGTYYDDGWAGRYHALDSELLSFVVQPTLAWRPAPWLALGAGIQLQYVKAETSAAIDFGALDTIITGGAFGGTPGQDDGEIRTELSGYAVGFSLGAVAEPREGTRIGVGFRAPVTHSLDGDARFRTGGAVGAGVAGVFRAFSATGAKADLRLPASVVVGFQQALGEEVTLFGDVNWLGWSRLGELRQTFDNPNQPDALVDLPWKDSVFITIGASWEVSETLTLRAGAAYDTTPTRDADRTPAIPDGDALWFAGGLRYAWSQDVVVDLAAGVTFTESSDVGLSATDPGNAFKGDLAGRVGGAGAVFAAIQVGMAF